MPVPQPLTAEELFRRYGEFVRTFVRRAGGVPEHEVDDIVQDVFVSAHRKGGYRPGVAQPRTWLAQVALGIVANRRRFWRRRRREVDERAVVEEVLTESTPFERAAAAEALVRVQHALDALDLPYRAVFVLFEIAGEPCDVIAAGLGIPVGTVHSRLNTARARFQKAFERAERPSATARSVLGKEAHHDP